MSSEILERARQWESREREKRQRRTDPVSIDAVGTELSSGLTEADRAVCAQLAIDEEIFWSTKVAAHRQRREIASQPEDSVAISSRICRELKISTEEFARAADWRREGLDALERLTTAK